MYLNLHNVTENFIISEMSRRQTQQYLLDCQMKNWVINERRNNYEREVVSDTRIFLEEFFQGIKRQLIIKSAPARINIANVLVRLADHIAVTA